ncbi:helix-turn-helix domain-containing protein (plasmid) [Streptomyces sp. DSM 116496]|uniref:AlbA family DNA-binding domain-containing protein n=1 Tax=Streptomyces stoeckheimensis TaxID=3344656 RepID=UPI0038B24232
MGSVILCIMPTYPHQLFTAPAFAIDAEMVRSFLELRLAESFTIDYKRNTDSVADTVAAMANTYGGIVLIGVDNDPKDQNLPGPLSGVKPSDKDRLVNKMVTVFDPPGWCPDVIPVTIDEKTLLVVRIDPDTVPRPLLYSGAARVRMDGRNGAADRRLLQLLFQQGADESAVMPGIDPRCPPDQHLAPHHRPTYMQAPPDVVIRASAARQLRRDGVRRRLRGNTIDALTSALSDRQGLPFGVRKSLPPALTALAMRAVPGERLGSWEVDPHHGSSRFVRISAGHGSLSEPPTKTGVRVECAVELTGGETGFAVHFDVLYWLGGERLAGELWVQTAFDAVAALTRRALPSLTKELTGTSEVATPPVELHIASGWPDHRPLSNSLSIEMLGERTGTAELRRGSEYLPEELVGVDDLKGATREALHNIALDWRFLHPQFPEIHG